MGLCIDKLSHVCGTKKGLQVFVDEETGKVNGFCFSCKKFVANPYGSPKTVEEVDLPEPKTPEEIEAEIAEVQTFPFVDVPSRKLRASDLEKFGTRVSLSEEDGKTPYALYHPMEKDGKLCGYYVKTLSHPSFTWSIGDVKGADPFGWKRALKEGAYRLIITEGLEDAISVEKIFEMHATAKDKDYKPSVVSLPNGVNSVKVLNKHYETITNTFREVVLCFDNDESGREAVQEANIILPHALTLTLPEKDANDCLLKGAAKAAFKSIKFDAVKPKNSRIISGDDLHDLAREPTPYGELTWPFAKMQKLLRGVRYGETIYIGAGVKMGKSELLNSIAAHFIKEHGVPVFMAKPEEANKKTYKLMAGKITGRVFHDPDVDFDYEAYDEARKFLRGKLYMVNLYQHLGWETLRKDIVMAAHMGCKAVFIDPITNLTNGVDSGEANTLLQSIAQELSAMALDLNIVIFIFCHLKAPDGNISKDVRLSKYKKGIYHKLGNCPHESGGDVLSNQFAGSRAMMRSCNLMLGLSGNKDNELDEEVRRMRWIDILEDREFGNSDSIPLIWNPNTTQYSEC